MCCGTTGYCYQMDIYRGKAKVPLQQEDVTKNLGCRVVLSMTSSASPIGS